MYTYLAIFKPILYIFIKEQDHIVYFWEKCIYGNYKDERDHIVSTMMKSRITRVYRETNCS